MKLPSDILGRFKTGLTRGLKRKAIEILKKEINKQAKKALSNKNVKKAVTVAKQVTVTVAKQVKKYQTIFGV